MKVTLISPHKDVQALGLRTLASCLKKGGHEVRLIFLPKPFIERYEEKTLNEVAELSKNADLIGISLMTNFFDNATQITQNLKKHYRIPIVWGGSILL